MSNWYWDFASSHWADVLEPIKLGPRVARHPPHVPHHFQAGQLYLRELHGMEGLCEGRGRTYGRKIVTDKPPSWY